MVPRVTIMVLLFSLRAMNPLKVPRNEQRAIPTITASTTETLCTEIIFATRTAATDIWYPIERSHPPLIMMIMTAVATIATCTFCTRMLVMFRGVRKFLDMILKNTISTTRRIGMDIFVSTSPAVLFLFSTIYKCLLFFLIAGCVLLPASLFDSHHFLTDRMPVRAPSPVRIPLS